MKLVNEALLRLMVGAQEMKARLQEEKGQTLAEYGLILAVIAVVVVGILTVALAPAIQGAFQDVVDAFGASGS